MDDGIFRGMHGNLCIVKSIRLSDIFRRMAVDFQLTIYQIDYPILGNTGFGVETGLG